MLLQKLKTADLIALSTLFTHIFASSVNGLLNVGYRSGRPCPTCDNLFIPRDHY
jgi:hypothetical protein